VIETRDLTKYYGERRAIGPLSFSIADHEIVGLLGLNGAGKTTTLRVLACDLLPSEGTVRVDGVDVVESPEEVRARIGWLPDTPPLYDEMTVGEYLGFAARLRGLTSAEADKRVPAALEQARLGDVRDQTIGTLSHGFRQRVGIAQAIVHRPRLLLLDEPISGLDPVQIVEMRELVRGLKQEHTVILSSHILSEISETCDRLLVLRDGEIVAEGTEAELSGRLLGGARVRVTVRGDAKRASETLAAVRGVRAVEAVATSERGDGFATFQLDADADVREAVAETLVAARLGLVELTRSERELESIFLRLAGKQGVTS
jgi:ABC-2 type transport system ATP-binding protein